MLGDGSSYQSNFKTINPSLLELSGGRAFAGPSEARTDAKNAGNTRQLPRTRLVGSLEVESKRSQTRSVDLLTRARGLGMKIWALEKLQRMICTMFDLEPDAAIVVGHAARGHGNHSQLQDSRASKADLSQMLKNEQINGPSDRDPTVAGKDIVLFKGPYLYVRDVDEKQRPIMVREYAQPKSRSEGEWPQFRSVAGGKCPFIDDQERPRPEVGERKEGARPDRRLQDQQESERAARTTTRSQQPVAVDTAHVLANTTRLNRLPRDASKQSSEKVTLGHRRQTSDASLLGQKMFGSRARAGQSCGQEPVASGLQQSNATSAIRSQVISSTAAQPGAKAGTNKEIHGLQRKVLEKNSGGPASLGISSQRVTDNHSHNKYPTAAEIGLDGLEAYMHNRRMMIHAQRDAEEEMKALKAGTVRKATPGQPRKDAKAGYCENCQEKFEDFDEVRENSRIALTLADLC